MRAVVEVAVVSRGRALYAECATGWRSCVGDLGYEWSVVFQVVAGECSSNVLIRKYGYVMQWQAHMRRVWPVHKALDLSLPRDIAAL